jgi:hypothetical protein
MYLQKVISKKQGRNYLDPDMLVRGTPSRIRIRTKMLRIRNTAFQHHLIKLQLQVGKNETIFSNFENRFDKTTFSVKK